MVNISSNMEKNNTIATIITTSLVVIFGMLLVMPMINSSNTDSKAGWTPEQIIWAYDSCISEGGAGDMVTDNGVNNYLQFCKKAIACAVHSEPAEEVNVNSFSTLSNLLAQCERDDSGVTSK